MNKGGECISQKLGRSLCIETGDTRVQHSRYYQCWRANAKEAKPTVILVFHLTLSCLFQLGYWTHKTRSWFVKAKPDPDELKTCHDKPVSQVSPFSNAGSCSYQHTPISDQRELSRQKKHKKPQTTPQHQSTTENDMEESLTQSSEEGAKNRMRSA